MEALAELQRAMASWGLREPQEGWKAWIAGVKQAGKDALAADGEGGPLSRRIHYRSGILAAAMSATLDLQVFCCASYTLPPAAWVIER